jgi:hypothetical protein
LGSDHDADRELLAVMELLMATGGDGVLWHGSCCLPAGDVRLLIENLIEKRGWPCGWPRAAGGGGNSRGSSRVRG